MPNTSATFDTPHNHAFKSLGALEPGQHWSAFDVPRQQALHGQANLFVMTIWNWHSTRDEKGRRSPTERAIAQDINDGTFWYRIRKPPVGTKRKTWVAHWNGLELAFSKGIAVLGVLKDIHSNRCSLEHVFDIGNPQMQSDGKVLWLQLKPHTTVGCEVRPIDIRQLVPLYPETNQLAQFNQQFEKDVYEALRCNATQRKARLAVAPRLPKRIEVSTTVFVRNPDVVAEVLLRAKGCCEFCGEDAPFKRSSDDTPYLEVHHRIPLAAGGEDVVENAVALCPNCHREAHYG